MRAQPEMPRVVIVGGSFGGFAAAKALARAPVEVTLIDALALGLPQLPARGTRLITGIAERAEDEEHDKDQTNDSGAGGAARLERVG